MIDVEEDVFDYVYPYVSSLLPEGGFVSEFVPSPSALPHATLIEMDNIPDSSMRGTADLEEYSLVTYESNVYAESKPACREIMNAIDEGMTRLGFSRMSMRFVPNLQDTTIYRIVARYRAAVNQDKTVFRKR